MYFTQEDYRKIEAYLKSKAARDTSFDSATTPLQGNETIVLVQGGKNVNTTVSDIVSQFFALGVSDFINVTDKYGISYNTLDEAIRVIPWRSRKVGQVITFLNEQGEWHLYQYQGESILTWNNTTLWVDLLESRIVNSILPDQEDLTMTEPDADGNSYMHFKDKDYSIDDFSGLGRVYLRKNLQTLTDPNTGETRLINYLTQTMVGKENVIYHIQYDYNLNGQTIIIPEGCILLFQGGTFTNGLIKSNNTIIEGDPKDSPLFGAFWTPEGKLYNPLLLLNNSAPDEVFSCYGTYLNTFYQSNFSLYPISVSGFAITDDYVVTFAVSNVSSTSSDYKSIFTVTDQYGNIISSGVVTNAGHANDAVYYNDYVYLVNTEGRCITRYKLEALVNGNNTIVEGEVFLEDVVCYGIDIDNNLIYISGDNIIYKYNFKKILVESIPITIASGGAFSTKSVYPLINQGIVVHNGILYINQTINQTTQLGCAISIYDLATREPITLQPIIVNTTNGESEGLCKYNNSLYMNVTVTVRGRFVNMIYKLPTYIKDSISTGTILNNQSLLNTGNTSSTYYIDNSYEEISDGSITRPFKSFDMALSSVTPKGFGCNFIIKNSTGVYNGFSLINCAVPITIDGGGSTIEGTGIDIRLCNRVYIKNITIKDTPFNIWRSNVEFVTTNFNKSVLSPNSYGVKIESNSITQFSSCQFTNVSTAIIGSYSIIDYFIRNTFTNVETICNITEGVIYSSQVLNIDQIVEFSSYPFNSTKTFLLGNSMKFGKVDIESISNHYKLLGNIPQGVPIRYSGISKYVEGYWDTNGYFIENSNTILGYREGNSSERPSLSSGFKGFTFYDTTLNQEILWNGTEWVNTDGTLTSKVVIV